MTRTTIILNDKYFIVPYKQFYYLYLKYAALLHCQIYLVIMYRVFRFFRSISGTFRKKELKMLVGLNKRTYAILDPEVIYLMPIY